MKNVLISFVGINDANKLKDGAILTVLRDDKQKYDEVHMLWNPSEYYNFYEIGKYVKKEIAKRKYCKDVRMVPFECDDVTDHNEIYPKLLNYCKSIFSKGKKYTAAVASGTPSMQACWILMGESGDFPLRLIRSDDPKYGKQTVRNVKLGTSLPRIIRIEKENKYLRKSFLPELILDIKKAKLIIDGAEVILSPVEFTYYRYFIQRIHDRKEYLRVDVHSAPEEFYNSVLKFHRQLFPEADSNRIFSEKNKCISSSTFRSNVSRLNKKIKEILKNYSLSKYFLIESEGERFRKSYGINLPEEKIKIVK